MTRQTAHSRQGTSCVGNVKRLSGPASLARSGPHPLVVRAQPLVGHDHVVRPHTNKDNPSRAAKVLLILDDAAEE